MKRYLILLLLLISYTGFGQQTPASAQKEAISITGVTAHIGDGTLIENATIVFENGKITAIGNASTTTKGTVINASGKHVYPGFIVACSSLGLVEVDAVKATKDFDEIGDMIPHIRSIIAYNAESKVVESIRPNGILLAQVSPKGGRISGTSSVVQLDAWNWEDAAIKTDDAIHLNWPSSFSRGRWWLGESSAYKPSKNYQKQIASVTSFLQNSAAYNKSTSKELNQAFASMKGLFNGSQKLYVYANGEREIIDAISTAKEANIANIVLVGAYEAHKITDFLKENNIAVLVRAAHSLPNADDDDYDMPYKLPKLLMEAGLTVGLQNRNAMNFQVRNLPFYAGQVAGQGLDKEKALQMITSNTAKILGIDANYGTLTVGKSATLFISEGDALDMRTNILSHAFIDGRSLSLETHQTKLWKRYMGKYNGK
ncbi:MAG: amidohydrolase family protein [Cellulophaga sp.]